MTQKQKLQMLINAVKADPREAFDLMDYKECLAATALKIPELGLTRAPNTLTGKPGYIPQLRGEIWPLCLTTLFGIPPQEVASCTVTRGYNVKAGADVPKHLIIARLESYL